MGENDPGDSPYLPPQLRQSCFDEVTANVIGIVPSGFSFKFVFFAIACNLMFSGATELLGSRGGRAEFGADILVFYGSPALNFALMLVGLLSIGCVKLGKKSLNVQKALKHVFLTTILCYLTVLIIYFCRGGQFFSY